MSVLGLFYEGFGPSSGWGPNRTVLPSCCFSWRDEGFFSRAVGSLLIRLGYSGCEDEICEGPCLVSGIFFPRTILFFPSALSTFSPCAPRIPSRTLRHGPVVPEWCCWGPGNVLMAGLYFFLLIRCMLFPFPSAYP